MTASQQAAATQTIAIIGGGPAGLRAAEYLAEAGFGVTIYDRMASLGRKFLLAGRGGLNLTHSEDVASFLTRYQVNPSWVAQWLLDRGPTQTHEWAASLGQELFVGSSGRVFPKAMKSSPLLRAWLGRLSDLGVEVRTRHRLVGFDDEHRPIVEAPNGQQLSLIYDAVLLALGGASWPKLGSDGHGIELLEQKGVAVSPLQPSNCGVKTQWSRFITDKLAGEVLKSVRVSIGDHHARGDLIITAQGLEGGPVYALGWAIREALSLGTCTLNLDMRPDLDVRALAEKLVTAKAGQSLSTALKTHGRLSQAAIGLMREVTDNVLPTSAMSLARLIKALPIPIIGLTQMDRAISTAGGIKRDAVDDNLMLVSMPSVFVAGEMLDWDAPTGGYLLQACLDSGLHAAAGIKAWLSSKDR